MRAQPFLAILVLCLLLHAAYSQPAIWKAPRCGKPAGFNCNPARSYFPKNQRIKIKYAKSTIGSVRYANTFVDFVVKFAGSSGQLRRQYRLIVCGCPVPPKTPPSRTLLFTNPKDIYVGDGPALFMVTELFEKQPLPVRYVSDLKFIYSNRVRTLGNRKAIFSIRSTGETNFPLLKRRDDMEIGLVTSSAFSYNSVVSGFANNYNRPLLVVAELNELTPLGRAEWVNLIGALFNKARFANNLFNRIEKSYSNAKAKVAGASRRPSAYFNYPYLGDPSKKSLDRYSWIQPGTRQYITQFFRDANVDYRYYFKGRTSSGNTLSLNKAVKDFGSARFLMNTDPYDFPVGYRSLFISSITQKSPSDSVKTGDFSRAVRKLHAVRCNHVWGRRRRVRGDALDFFESAVARPDLLLKDYVKIMHPDVNLGKHKLYYMSQYVKRPSDKLSCPHINLFGKPAAGRAYVDKTIRVTGLDRFDVQDQLDSNVYPQLKKVQVRKGQVDVQFRRASVKNEKSVVFVVRILRQRSTARIFASSPVVLQAFKNGLKKIGPAPVTVAELGAKVI